jgi:diaminopimelate decarboxylase/aspartate kinase
MAEDGARVLVVVSALSGVTNELQAIASAPIGAGATSPGALQRCSGIIARSAPNSISMPTPYSVNA